MLRLRTLVTKLQQQIIQNNGDSSNRSNVADESNVCNDNNFGGLKQKIKTLTIDNKQLLAKVHCYETKIEKYSKRVSELEACSSGSATTSSNDKDSVISNQANTISSLRSRGT
jgi:predicted RNase H-like nuclease (RuvC/YqgF family)